MRVMIFADMEGVAGIQSWEYTGGEGERYEEGRRLYTAEIAAAVRGCKKAGATEIWAVDGHGGSSRRGRPFMNWINEYLEPGARYVQGYPWARYVAPFESGIDCVAFVGAHAMAGVAEGVLSHTVSSASPASWRRSRDAGMSRPSSSRAIRQRARKCAHLWARRW